MHRFHPTRVSLALGLGLFVVSCGVEQRGLQANPAPLTFADFKARTYVEPGSGLYVVDGDTPVRGDEALMKFYHDHVLQRSEGKIASVQQPLIVHQSGGTDATWASPQRQHLTYCVSAAFGANQGAVVAAMYDATARAWEEVANIHFVHDAGQDSSCDEHNNNVVFDVRPAPAGASYLARAFFPDSARPDRNILIAPDSFTSSPYTLAGILRHEVGHVLGFRHEHTRPEAGTCFEDTNWRALTPYDARSVMHYPQCNGSNRGDLVLTQTDRVGAAQLYGGVNRRDFDGDGQADILWHNAYTGDLSVWFLDGTAVRFDRYLTRKYAGTDWKVKGTGDFDGDGQTDILWHNAVTGDVSVWFLDGTTVRLDHFLSWKGSGWEIKGTGDFDRDGKTDILWYNTSTGDLSVWFLDGTTVRFDRYLTRKYLGTDWQIKGTGDFDGDGQTDILWHNASTGDVSVWFLDAGGTTVRFDRFLSWKGSGWEIKGTGDFDRDGRTDILWYNTAAGDLSVWFLDGTTVRFDRYLTRKYVGTDWQIVSR